MLSRKRNLSLTSMRLGGADGVVHEGLAGVGVALGVGEREAAGDALAEFEAAVDFDGGVECGCGVTTIVQSSGGKRGPGRWRAPTSQSRSHAFGQVGDRDDAGHGDRDGRHDERGEQAPHAAGEELFEHQASTGAGDLFAKLVHGWSL